MKSKQSLFEQIISVSIRKVRERSVAGQKDQFEHRMKNLPTKVKQLNACPYMFIFQALIAFPDQVDFVLTQYQNMIKENFLNPNINSKMLSQHFRSNLNNHSFRIIQTLMDVKDPNLQFFQLFFEIHNSIAMPQNILEDFKYTGYRWLARAFAFKKYSRPAYIDNIFLGILKLEERNLQSQQQQKKITQNYIGKILANMTQTVQNNLKSQTERVQSKYGFCFVCGQPADFYCKDTKISVCGTACKKTHISQITDNPCLDFQYTEEFKDQIQKLLFNNLKMKKNVALSIEYLCSIYMNGNYIPKHELPHKDLFTLPIIVERVWLLYTMYYHNKNQMFEHIIADCLKSKIDYVSVNSIKYFLRVVETSRIIQIHQFLDYHGFRRIIPIIINNLHDEQYKMKFIYCLIDRVYENEQLNLILSSKDLVQKQSSTQSSLLRSINFQKNPIQNFKLVYTEKQGYNQEQCTRQMMRFIIKNQQKVNKSKICDFILANDVFCKLFLQQLFLQIQQKQGNNKQKKIKIKLSPLIDQILRQMFYFLNIKISDKIYHLLQLLCQVLDFKLLQPSSSNCMQQELQVVFSTQNTSSPDTMFQFAYFIIMIVTELHNPINGLAADKNNKDKKKITQAQFVNRVKSFDSKFAQKQKKYIVDVYYRLVQQPFSQETRGILTRYPQVKKNKHNKLAYNPVMTLLDNWQTIYQCMSGMKNQLHTLSRCCNCLCYFPTICQPFFQLLLYKLTNQEPASQVSNHNQVKVVNQSILQQQHLLLYINNLIQFSPNCVSHSSWEYLFLRHPVTDKHIFELGTLVYHSNSLTLSNFIWFVKQFCSTIKISQNLDQCLKLMQYNYKKHSSIPLTSDQKSRIQILNKQYGQKLFVNETNYYYQMQLIKGMFQIGNFQLGIVLLDIAHINIVSERIIIQGIIQIVQRNWQQIQAYGNQRKDKSKVQREQLIEIDRPVNQKQGLNKQHHISQGEGQQTNKIWIHILNKAITIGIGCPQLLQQLSILLHSIPQLNQYFQILNIQHAIVSALQGRLVAIDYSLTRQLTKFQQHISQMYNAKFSIKARGGHQNVGLLDQFVCRENILCIIKHFQYFWDIQELYHILVQLLLERILNIFSLKFNALLQSKPSQNNSSDNKKHGEKKTGKQQQGQIKLLIYEQVGIQIKDYELMLNVLTQKQYLNLMILENRLQPTIGFINIVIKYLEIELQVRKNSQNESNSLKQQIDKLSKLLNLYKEQQLKILDKVILPNVSSKILGQFIEEFSRSQMDNQNDQVERLSIYEHYILVYNMLTSYLNPLYIISTQLFKILEFAHSTQHIKKSTKQLKKFQQQISEAFKIESYYQIRQITKCIDQINNQFKYRCTVFQDYSKSYADVGIRLPPGLIQQEFMSYVLNILFSQNKKPTNQLKQQDSSNPTCNLQELKQFLQINMIGYRKLLQCLKKSKNKNKKQNKQKSKEADLKSLGRQNSQIHNSMALKRNKTIQGSASLSNSNNINLYQSTVTVTTLSNTNQLNIQKVNSSTHISSSQQSLQKQQKQNYQLQLLNQKITGMKRVLYSLCNMIENIVQRHLTNKIKFNHDQSMVRSISQLLVEFLQLGFDFYNPQTHTFDVAPNQRHYIKHQPSHQHRNFNQSQQHLSSKKNNNINNRFISTLYKLINSKCEYKQQKKE